MRWSIVGLIWRRELRDQLRDRRTLFMVAGLPILLYPFLGIAVIKFAVDFADRKITVGIVQGPERSEDFPPRRSWEPLLTSSTWFALTPAMPGCGGLDQAAAAAALAESSRQLRAATGLSPVPALGWLAAAPAMPGIDGLPRMSGTVAFAEFSRFSNDYPLLVRDNRFDPAYLRPIGGSALGAVGQAKLQIQWLHERRRELLDEKKVDVLMWAEPDFWLALDHGQARVHVEYRDNDENSRFSLQRLQVVLMRWKKQIKEVRFVRHQLPTLFDDPFEVKTSDGDKSESGGRTLVDMLVKILPFMLVMWSLAGALYPAVDLCAGEKERGTMETLLISPAGREEIVWGKFLTIWVFSGGTALLNVASMGITMSLFAGQVPQFSVSTSGLIWCILLLLPLSAFFSAVCLAIGAYARSTKEGQYYLMPLFLVTLPLVFLTLAPGVELNSFYSMVPVTGVALLMQRLLTGVLPGQTWFYFVSVMAPIALYSWLALRWAIDQFQREEVLFREAERIDLRLWMRRLFREKETRPTTGMALFCFGLLLVLRWFSDGLGREIPLLARSGIITVAFVIAPPVFMALLLTSRPRQVLAIRLPAWPYIVAAILLVPLLQFAVVEAYHFERLRELLDDLQEMVATNLDTTSYRSWTISVMLLGILTAAGKEIAFRGFIFAGLLKRMRPWPAILVSSFLFAAFHMNVYLLPPLFVLGIALGMLAMRSGSLLPGLILHASGYCLMLFGADVYSESRFEMSEPWLGMLAGVGAVVASTLLWWQNRRSGSGFFKALVALPQPETFVTPALDQTPVARPQSQIHSGVR
jgi:sodium transport system permease protein